MGIEFITRAVPLPGSIREVPIYVKERRPRGPGQSLLGDCDGVKFSLKLNLRQWLKAKLFSLGDKVPAA